jgi:hypothetical protein
MLNYVDESSFRRIDVGRMLFCFSGDVIAYGIRLASDHSHRTQPRFCRSWDQSIRYTPVCHTTIGIAFYRLLKTFYSFMVIEAVRPCHATVEPFLRLWVRGCDWTSKCPKIVVFTVKHHRGNSVNLVL